jgi:hypothetical protein
MTLYTIIETDDGLTVAEMAPDATAEEAAVAHDGVLVDPGPYNSFEEAYDALLELSREDEEERESTGIV